VGRRLRIEPLVCINTAALADRQRVAYRLAQVRWAVHHLDGFAFAGRGEVGAERRPLAVSGESSHDHGDLVARVDDVGPLIRCV
jgi:hypothetical protein